MFEFWRQNAKWTVLMIEAKSKAEKWWEVFRDTWGVSKGYKVEERSNVEDI